MERQDVCSCAVRQRAVLMLQRGPGTCSVPHALPRSGCQDVEGLCMVHAAGSVALVLLWWLCLWWCNCRRAECVVELVAESAWLLHPRDVALM